MIKTHNCSNWDYPDISIADSMIQVVHNDGLITPLVIKGGEICRRHREKFMAFKTESIKLGVKEPTIIACDFETLTDEEQREF